MSGKARLEGKDIRQWIPDDFAPYMGEELTITDENGNSMAAQLTQVQERSETYSNGSRKRPFSLLFQCADPSTACAGGTCSIKHGDIGELVIFLVRIIPPATENGPGQGAVFQATFN